MPRSQTIPGADRLTDYENEDFSAVVNKLTDGKGVNLIQDFFGAPCFERNIHWLDYGGRLIQTGIMAGIEKAKMPLDRLLYRHLQISGREWGLMESYRYSIDNLTGRTWQQRLKSVKQQYGLLTLVH